MEIQAKEFSLPKKGSAEAEYEDAISVSKDHSRFAVADGATETSFSGVWAKQLVRAFTNHKISIPLGLEELTPLQKRWERIVHRHPLPWYAEEKARTGAFAAFLGLELADRQEGGAARRRWRAIAAGDSCLIQVRGGPICSFPLTHSSSFTSSPNLVSTSSGSNRDPTDLFQYLSGEWRCEDSFFLMTDALACWFFKEAEEGAEPWKRLLNLGTGGEVSFKDLVTDLRADGRLKNDDVTLLRVDVLR